MNAAEFTNTHVKLTKLLNSMSFIGVRVSVTYSFISYESRVELDVNKPKDFVDMTR